MKHRDAGGSNETEGHRRWKRRRGIEEVEMEQRDTEGGGGREEHRWRRCRRTLEVEREQRDIEDEEGAEGP